MNLLGHLENPVARRELAYQRRTADLSSMKRLRWLYRVIYYPALALALLIFWSEFEAALQPGETASAAMVLHTVVIFTLVAAVLMHLFLLMQTLVRAATSIAREKQAGTWEDLLMTGTTARRLVIGKWWATLRGLFNGYLLLIPLRTGVVVWLGAVFDRSQMMNIVSVRDVVAPTAWAFLATFGVIALFTFGAAAMVAAVGILASALTRKMVTALAAAFLLAGLVFGGVLITLAGVEAVVTHRADTSMNVQDVINPLSENVLISWLDNGLSLTSTLVNYQTEYVGVSRQYVARYYGEQRNTAWLLALIGSAALYAALTWGLLWLAQRVVMRQGALPSVH